jgi:transglutaminase-like putative cysteine protease
MPAMRILATSIVSIICLSMATPVFAQFKNDVEPEGTKVGESRVSRWQAGMIVVASGGTCRGLTGYVPIPTDWPEQEVKTVAEDISPEAKVHYETVDGGVRLMNVRIAELASGQEAKVLITVEIRRSVILPPENTDIYVFADPKKLPSDIRRFYLSPSPKIESRDPKIRDLAKTIGADKEKAWEKIEAIYDWVREKVKYQNGPLKGALAALKDGTGDCEELTSLFIAICRAADIPARTVWVQGHCYPEFYLQDDKGQGHWFPCQAAGTREFGGITELRPILQKGDSFRPPKNSKERQRYMAEYLTGSPTPGGGKPQVRFVREAVSK